MKQLARKDIDAALKTWRQLQPDADKALQDQARRVLVLQMTRQDHKDVIDWMDSVIPAESDKYYIEKRLRTALSLQRWDMLLKWLDSAPRDFQEKENWRYWRAHATEAMGKPREAETQFKALAAERSYHGFLSADRVGLDYHLGNTPLVLPRNEILSLTQQPGLKRAKELLALDHLLDARREWHWATRNMDQVIWIRQNFRLRQNSPSPGSGTTRLSSPWPVPATGMTWSYVFHCNIGNRSARTLSNRT
ncbi:hypothetical protein BOW51_03510 [Solemya velesiana gill symbiont]|uniref:Lytic transglycosylase superhelical linker domain-containing protein n=1 Tax=Solemya velesiana gill symbiont TaxID=1918948 RepID=A0A1T2KWI0_9GAMM|nr:hypothetical protein [Solemya velesiana gill symbiont]OOZ37195.1 hypothetical protein BOW51_03510 [Solemya velesiana gill symbiont]